MSEKCQKRTLGDIDLSTPRACGRRFALHGMRSSPPQQAATVALAGMAAISTPEVVQVKA